ncbi:MAG TPA: cupin-like domain-containing protein [Steroidobacteraceae bacterium]|nr:cupin-like domain-containing protein [Steroidobacteraceae bacterium]
MPAPDLVDYDSLPKTAEWRNVDLKTLRGEIIPRDRPAVLKGLVDHWPIVRAGAQSDNALYEYLRARDQNRPIRILVGKPDIKGVYFYREDMTGLNFEFAQQPFHQALANILACKDHANPPAIYTGATLVSETCPDVARENFLEILDRPARPRMWLGNAVTAATHYDSMHGVNCMVAGRKRFVFFPPEQLPNLYIGPLELAPGGQPTSMVRMSAPDLERYPRFAQALAAAETVEVAPGDAIFIPNHWWHNVESLDPVNLSVNYWWLEEAEKAEPFAALAHALLAITPLSASRRELWHQMFEHYVFQTNGDPVPYLPPDRRGMLGPLSPELETHMRTQLIRSLTKPMPAQLREQILRLLWPMR